MKKQNRIKKRKEFNYIFKNGENIGGKFVSVLTTNNKKNIYKVGFSVSKKVGKAVVRNKVKRRIKEAVYFYRDLLQKKTNYIFVAKSKASEATFEEIKNNVEFLLTKFNKVKENCN